METQNVLFLMHLNDGYSFRNFWAIIKNETERVSMVFSRNKIEISFLNTLKSAVHKILLNSDEFTQYIYNIRDNEGKLWEEYPIAVDTNEFFNTTKAIGRRDSLRIYLLPGSDKINIQPITTSAKNPGHAGALFVKIITLEHTRHDVKFMKIDPNVRVQSKDFADLCCQANTLKCSSLEICGQDSAVTFTGIRANKTIAFVNKYASQTCNSGSHMVPVIASNVGDICTIIDNFKLSANSKTDNQVSRLSLNVIDNKNLTDLTTVNIPISTVKSFSKIHNISFPGTLLRFYFEKGAPTKIESPIGTYGSYTIYLR